MARFVDRLVQDGHDSPIDVIVDPNDGDLIDARHRRLRHHWWAAFRDRDELPLQEDFNASFMTEVADNWGEPLGVCRHTRPCPASHRPVRPVIAAQSGRLLREGAGHTPCYTR